MLEFEFTPILRGTRFIFCWAKISIVSYSQWSLNSNQTLRYGTRFWPNELATIWHSNRSSFDNWPPHQLREKELEKQTTKVTIQMPTASPVFSHGRLSKQENIISCTQVIALGGPISNGTTTKKHLHIKNYPWYAKWKYTRISSFLCNI